MSPPRRACFCSGDQSFRADLSLVARAFSMTFLTPACEIASPASTRSTISILAASGVEGPRADRPGERHVQIAQIRQFARSLKHVNKSICRLTRPIKLAFEPRKPLPMLEVVVTAINQSSPDLDHVGDDARPRRRITTACGMTDSSTGAGSRSKVPCGAGTGVIFDTVFPGTLTGDGDKKSLARTEFARGSL